MSISTSTNTETDSMFQLKGGLYPLTVLQLLGTDLRIFEQQLETKVQQAPKFFYHAPVVIDLQKLNQSQITTNTTIDFNNLMNILLKKNLVPVGVKGGSASQQTAASTAGLAILQDNAKESSHSQTTTLERENWHHSLGEGEQVMQNSSASTKPFLSKAETFQTDTTTACNSHYKIIVEPVRSGQQVYAPGCDLIVLAPVSHGAEVLSDGNIHIYGPLRGRALAGVTGDENTHIFCQSLEAELISIAGQYKISEDIDQSLWCAAVDVFIKSGHLHIRPF